VNLRKDHYRIKHEILAWEVVFYIAQEFMYDAVHSVFNETLVLVCSSSEIV